MLSLEPFCLESSGQGDAPACQPGAATSAMSRSRGRVASLVCVAGGGLLAVLAARWYYLRQRVLRSWAHGVEVRRSRIPRSGDGLFASRDFAAGEQLGEYRGRVLSLLQATRLEDRDYLMGGFGINSHVDARFALDAPARYVNDNFDKSKLNAEFEKDKAAKRAKLVATRAIRRGEEIYASYGESYWSSRGIDPTTGALLPCNANK